MSISHQQKKSPNTLQLMKKTLGSLLPKKILRLSKLLNRNLYQHVHVKNRTTHALMMMIAPNSRARNGGKEREELKGEYGGI